MADDFDTYHTGLSDTAANAAAITPHDSTDLSRTTRGIYVGGAGNVSVEMKSTGTAVVFQGLAAGTILPVRATRVNATGTTATNLIALW